jgi:hypothetical protein
MSLDADRATVWSPLRGSCCLGANFNAMPNPGDW